MSKRWGYRGSAGFRVDFYSGHPLIYGISLQVKGELTTVENLDNTHQSFARLDYHEECEAAINEQINIEYNISYVYHALHSFFDRCQEPP